MMRDCVLGRYTPGASVGKPGTTIEGYWPQIIDEDLWKRAQAILRRRAHGRSTRIYDGRVPNLLAGLARCARCGNPVQRFAENGRNDALRCQTPGCVASNIWHRDAELAVLALLRDQIRTDDIEATSGERAELRGRLSEIERESVDIERQIDYTIEVASHGGISAERTASRTAKFEQRLTEIRGEVDVLKSRLICLDTGGVAQGIDRLRALMETYQSDDHDARRRIADTLRQIVDHVVVDTVNQQLIVTMFGSNVRHVLTPCSQRFRYIETSTPVRATQIHVPDDGDAEDVETELIGGNIIVDRYPVNETIFVRPRVEKLSEGHYLIYPRELAAGASEMLSLSQAAAISEYEYHSIGILCRRGRIPGAVQGVDGRWSIPRGSISAVKRVRKKKGDVA